MRWDLKVNWKKTKVIRVARKREECQVMVGEEQLEQVDDMKYLEMMTSGMEVCSKKWKRGLELQLELLEAWVKKCWGGESSANRQS